MYFVQFSIIALGLVFGYSDAYRRVSTDAVSTERMLIKSLLEIYENVGLYGRPVNNQSETLEVGFGAALLDATLVEKYDHSAIFALNTWDRFLWTDSILKWNPKDFAGVDHVRLPINQIWKPDITLYNGHPGKDSISDALAVVMNDGTVLYIPPHMTYVTCPIKGNTYSCTLKYGSWTYDGYKMDLYFYDGLKKSLDMNDYNGQEFTVSENSAKRDVKHYPCCDEPYISLVYTFNLKAK
eukprot:GHVU01217396.1.p1 GENE.GHVU01217396.1~~GHVU01217396.1.p1  ORF type:complete len:239 (-),score=26.35 GHVU01217396.1:653-1369(-)